MIEWNFAWTGLDWVIRIALGGVDKIVLDKHGHGRLGLSMGKVHLSMAFEA